jgi:NADH-quinone oxidoreductase subunit D
VSPYSNAPAESAAAIAHSLADASSDSSSEAPPEAKSPTLKINMGPQHPATHGVLRLELELDRETVLKCRPVIGYLHTGIEKSCEARTYVQALTLTDRLDYLNPLGNNLAYCLAVEALFQCEIPERAQIARVLLAELTRINSHLVCIGSGGMDLGVTSIFLYALRERERILDLFESLTGQRMMTSFIRPGGLASDLPEEWLARTMTFLESLPVQIDEIESMATDNPFFKQRTQGIGIVSAEDLLALGVTGPLLRAAGVDHDLRVTNPYSGYDRFQIRACTQTAGDCYARYKVRVAEMRQSITLCQQAIEQLPKGPVKTSDRKIMPPPKEELAQSMESLIHHFKLWTEGMKPPKGEAYVGVESPRGELGFYIVSDGTGRPQRVRERAPSFAAVQAMSKMMEGGSVADAVAIIASCDPILGEVDR